MFRGSNAPVPPFTFTTFVLQLILDCRGSSAPVPPGSLGWCSTKRDINGIHVNGPSGSPWVTLLLSFQNEICSSMSADSMETLGLLLYDKDNIFFPNQNQRGRPLLSPLWSHLSSSTIHFHLSFYIFNHTYRYPQFLIFNHWNIAIGNFNSDPQKYVGFCDNSCPSAWGTVASLHLCVTILWSLLILEDSVIA